MRRSSLQIAFGLALGAGAGVAIAMIAGLGGLWLAVGIGLGIAIESWMTKKSKNLPDRAAEQVTEGLRR
jgi:hypothetical protein